MKVNDTLKGKSILIADDEPDILETLEESLDMCLIDTAPDFETAKKFLNKNQYNAVILDIMGVQGYDLLQITTGKGVPTLMLTAHALDPAHLIKAIKKGAGAYMPKDRIVDIPSFLADLLEAHQGSIEKQGKWFNRLRPFFDKKFGSGWREKDKEFWDDFNNKYLPTKKELENLI